MISLLLASTCARPSASTTASPCPEGDAPDVVVCRFYEQVLAMRPAGLPTLAEQEALNPYLSLRLQRLLDDARSYQEAYARNHPEDKPPFVDGSLFTSLFEGPSTFEVVRTDEADDQAQVFVCFRYDQTEEWMDSAIVIRQNGRYIIDDILLSGVGPFNPGGRLSETLRWREG